MKLNKIKALIINIIKINEIFLYVKNAHNLFYINTFLVFGAAVFESFSISLILPILKNLQNDIVEKGLIERTLEQVLKIFNIEFNIINLLIFFTICQLLKYIFVFYQLHMSRVLSSFVTKNLRIKSTQNLIKKNLNYFDKNNIGNSISTIFISTQSSGAALEYLTLLIKGLVFSFAYILIASTISPELTFMVIAMVLLSYFFLISVFKKSESLGEIEKNVTDQSISYLTDKLQGIRVMKVFQLEKIFTKELSKKYEEFEKNQVNIMDNKILTQMLFEPILFLFFIFVLLLSITTFSIPLDTLMVLILIFILVIPQLKVVNSQIVTINGLFGHFNKVKEINEKDLPDVDTSNKFFKLEKEIEFKNIFFQYPETDKLVLNNINIKIPAYQTTIIVGKSGCGKSTLINLLLNFYIPQSGNINLDDINLNKINKESWFKKISYVDQYNYLFNESLNRNIFFGNVDADTSELDEIKKQTLINDINFNNTHMSAKKIGTRGTLLSGGQRQRIAIARALIRKPELLILDEATSELDVETDKFIQNSIEKLTNKMTIIIVAHKLDLIKKAKNIIFLESGKVSEVGSYDELISNKDSFYNFINNTVL
ncbi:ABC transporter ATP-binding protein [Alphaproteobacteria bacterium]|nr:ABC transporter ATP-binding protein [Alphaproteobacteria bacterium]